MNEKHISSRDNPQYKALRQLASSTQARRRAGQCLLDGIHLCQAYLDQVGLPHTCVVGESARSNPEVAAIVARAGARCLVLADGLFGQLSQVEHGIELLFVIDTPSTGPAPVLTESAVLLDNVQDPGNVGSILRSAAAAGIRVICCGPGTAFAWSSKVLRAGMGGHFALTIHENVDLAECVRTARVPVYATSSHASATIYELDLHGEAGWLFGHEGQGVSDELMALTTASISIPHLGPVESLNVAASAAVCFFEQVRQKVAKSGAG
ncbi:TrmH family RNA methyltransferase [Lacisediminimonas profundi]|uniref:TrmH family RNA methyltransferase n=1 Tax=Lacisediminimonas profundi TaxID=2603856 RepID=UPI00124B715C|nr:RNA methyltransferase [Lacisediminimonas profundi]